MSEQQPNEQQVEEQINDKPVPQSGAQPRLDTFDPVPESETERESLIKELEEMDAPDEREAPTSEDTRP